MVKLMILDFMNNVYHILPYTQTMGLFKVTRSHSNNVYMYMYVNNTQPKMMTICCMIEMIIVHI